MQKSCWAEQETILRLNVDKLKGAKIKGIRGTDFIIENLFYKLIY